MKNKLILPALLTLLLPALAPAASITLTNTDPAAGITSFNTKTNWDSGAAPTAGNDYFTLTNGMRTPLDGVSYTFAGDSLNYNPSNNVSRSGYSMLESATAARTLTINNFTNNGGIIRSRGGHTFAVTIAGNVYAVAGNSAIWADQNGWIIKSPLVGGDGVVLTNQANAAQAQDTISLQGTNSGFTGTFLLTSGTTKFQNIYSVPGNPATPNPRQITLNAATLQDDVGVSLTNGNGGITLGGASTLITATAGSNTVVGVPITGAFTLTKSGAGTLTLAGSNSMTGLTLSGATAGSRLNIASTNALGTGTFTVTSGDNATIDNTSGSALTLLANNPQQWNNNFAFAGSSDLNMGSGAITMSAARTVTVSSNKLTLGGKISGAFSLTKAGAGTLSLLVSNAYTGGTTLSGGTLIMNDPYALGTNGFTFSGTANAMLDIATDGGDYTNVINAGSSSVWTIASDVKTGSAGINHNLGTFLIGSGGTPLQMNVVRGPNVTSGSPQITAPLILSGGSGGTTIVNPTTANVNFSSVTATATSKTLQLDGTNTGNTVTGAITDGGANVITLVKTNISTWTLGGANSFSGNTTVAQGTLALGSGGSLASPNISVAAGATLDVSASSYALGAAQTLGGNGTVAGNFSDNTGSQIAPGGAGTVGTLTFNNNLTLAAGDTNKFDFATGSNDLIVVSGNLNPGVGSVINLASLPPGGLANGTYTLMQVSGSISGSATDFTITGKPSPSRQSFTIVYATSPNRVQLQVTGSPAALVWLGTPGLIWDIVTTANWTNAASLSTDIYFDGDNVSFTDAGVANQPVLNTTVQPGSVTFNSTSDYLLSGTGAIGGSSGLTKSGVSTLTIATTNNYTGVTALNGGTVSVNTVANGGVASPLGAASSASANRTFNGGKLQYTGDTASTDRGATLNAGGAVLEVANPATTLTVSGAIIGSSGGALTKTGDGTLALSGANTYNGATTVSTGALTVSGGNGLPDTGALVLADVSGVALTVSANETIGSLAGGGYNGGNATVNGALTLGGDNSSTAYGGNIGGTGGLTKRGTGTFTLTNSSSFAGNLFVKSGAVVFDVGGSANTAAYCSIGQDGTDNGTLTLKGGSSFTTANDFNLGDLGSSTGTLNIQDGANLSVAGFYIGSANAAGSSATGMVNQTGGNVSQTSAALGTFIIGGRTSTNGVGIYNLSGGQLTATAPVRMSGNGSCTFNQSGGTFTSASTSGGINLQRFAGPGGTYNLNGGTFQPFNIDASVVSTDPTFHSVFNFNGGTLQPTANNAAFMPAHLSAANVRNGGAIIDTAGFNIAILQPLQHSSIGGDNATDGGLIKQNSGVLTLTATNTYTGPTVINAGTLTVSGALGAGAVTVNSGATLNGTGALGGSVTNLGGTIMAGANNGILTINNNLVLDSGTAQFNFAAGTNSTLTVGGGVNVSGATTVNLNFIGVVPPVGTNTLIRYGTTLTGFANLTVGTSNPRYVFALTNDAAAKELRLVVTGVPVALTWVGDGSFNAWDNTPSYLNWLNGASPDYFYDGDNVTFNDSGSTTPSVYVLNPIIASSVTVNSANDYDFAGSGSVAAASLTKSGAGKLTLEVTNAYASATINAGTLQVGNGSTTGALLVGGALTNNGALVFNRSDAATLTNDINGSGSVANVGSGSLSLNGSNSYTGPTVISGGFLFPRNASALGTAASGTTATNGGQLYIEQALNFPDEALTLGGAGLRKGGNSASTLGGSVTLVANTIIHIDGGATLNLTNATGIAGSGFNLEINGDGGSVGTIAGPLALDTGTLTKNGGGTWAIGPVNTYSGVTTVNGGTLRLTGSEAFGVEPGSLNTAQINLTAGEIEATTNLVLNHPNSGLTVAAGTFGVDAGMTMTISNPVTVATSLTKSRPGTLILSGNNSLSGTLFVDTASTTGSDGILRVTSMAALGGVPDIQIRNNQGPGSSTLQLDGASGSLTLGQTFEWSGRNNFVPAIENFAGNNTWNPAAVTLNSGGGFYMIASAAGTLTIPATFPTAGPGTARSLVFGGAGDILVSGVIQDGGSIISLIKTNAGTLTLANANAYGNVTTVGGGVLLLTGSITSTGGVFVAGGTLSGTGVVNDKASVQPGGTLSPGLGLGNIGTLTINSNLTLAGVVAVDINKTTGNRDQVVGLNTVTYGGTLSVTNLAGTLALGNSFTLFSAAAHVGNFTNILGSPGTGLAYSFTNGVLSVVTGMATNPTNITATVSGNQLTLTWPADHTGWILQSQTNSLATGLATNWFDVAGSSANNTNVITINPASPTVFYRLRLP